MPYKHLLVPVDDSDLCERAMNTSVELARALGATVTGLIVEPVAALQGAGHTASSYLDALESHKQARLGHAAAVMSRFESLAEQAGVPFCGRYLCTTMVDEAISEVARAQQCDLLVMATHARSGLAAWWHGSHTKGVLARSPLPVLVLR